LCLKYNNKHFWKRGWVSKGRLIPKKEILRSIVRVKSIKGVTICAFDSSLKRIVQQESTEKPLPGKRIRKPFLKAYWLDFVEIEHKDKIGVCLKYKPKTW
jgi:hypothetical protein